MSSPGLLVFGYEDSSNVPLLGVLSRAVRAAVLLLGIAGGWLAAQAADASADSVLVLRNGRVLVGRVCRMGDSYVVALGANGEARLTASEVETICGSLDEAYFYKRDQLRPDDLPGRLDLAEWCLRNRCAWRAADQLLAVFNVAPAHPRLAVLERRLLSTDAMNRAAESASSPAASSAGDVQLVAAPATLPDGATVYFTQKVQPVLMNRCASNACHGSRSSQKFQLARSVRGQPMSNRMTQQNLQATLAFIDAQRPEDSLLLVAPRQSHGGLAGPVFGIRESAQYDQLLAWVRLVTRQRSESEEAIAEVSPPERAPLISGRDIARSAVQQASFTFPVEEEAAVVDTPSPRSGGLQRLPEAALGPEDPFDPETFNRQFANPPPGPSASESADVP